MQKITLYRYARPDGGVTVSPEVPDAEYTQLTRLVAAEGCVLTDGAVTAPCVDTDATEAWEEVQAAVTEADYQAALKEFGVTL